MDSWVLAPGCVVAGWIFQTLGKKYTDFPGIGRLIGGIGYWLIGELSGSACFLIPNYGCGTH